LQQHLLSGVFDYIFLQIIHLLDFLLQEFSWLGALHQGSSIRISSPFSTLKNIFLLQREMPFFKIQTVLTLSLLLMLVSCGGGGSEGTTATETPSTGTAISSVVFSDPSLAACIESDAATHGLQFTDEVTSLDCSASNIRALNGLQSFTKLETLDLSNNKVSDISTLSELSNIKTLDISSIQSLRNIDALLSLDKLINVDLSESGNEDITCASLDALSQVAGSVIAPDNYKQLITDVVFTDDLLESCVLSAATQNGFKFTRDITALECVDLGFSQLDGIEPFGNLVSLNINGNQVFDLSTLEQLAKLEFLFVAENPITDVFPLSALPALVVLDLSGIDGLTNIDALATLTTLKELLLDNTCNGVLGCATLDTLSNQLNSTQLNSTHCTEPTLSLRYAY
jgi:Leucine-rich repeat (LRR) protein